LIDGRKEEGKKERKELCFLMRRSSLKRKGRQWLF
jgi:hypothetical protein